eukprot:5829948-Pleurochrysis_carterae.AAC.2
MKLLCVGFAEQWMLTRRGTGVAMTSRASVIKGCNAAMTWLALAGEPASRHDGGTLPANTGACRLAISLTVGDVAVTARM